MKLNSFIPSRIFTFKVLKLIIPIALGQMLVAMVSFVDQLMVGRVNVDEPLTSVLVASEIMYVAMGVNLGIALIGDIFAAQFFGAKMFDKFKAVTKLKVIFNLISAALCVGIINIFATPLIKIFVNSEVDLDKVLNTCLSYLRLISISHVMYAITISIAGSLNTIGKPRYQLYVSLMSLLLNIGFNYIFIYVLDYQVDGAAYSTIIARLVEMGLILFCLYLNRQLAWFGWQWWIWDWKVLKSMLRRSLIVTSQVAFAIGLAAKTAVWTNYYPELRNAFGMGYTISGLLWATFPAFSAVAKILIGKRMARDEFATAYSQAKQMMFLSIVISLVLGLITLNFAFWLPEVVGLKNQEITAARHMIIVESVLLVFIVIGIYCFSLLEAGGFSRVPTFLNSYYILIVVFPFAIVMSKFWHPSFNLAYWLTSIVHFVGVGLISLPFFFNRKWLRNITISHVAILEPTKEFKPF